MPIRGTSQPSTRQWIVNPHLDGSPFLIGTGPVGILLCHGFTATTAEVKPLSSHLCAADFTVSAPLLPGHYTRPQDLNRVSWKDWVATVEDSYHDLFLRCKGVFVGGESTGGILALYLASKHPEIAGILAYAPALRLNLSLIEILMVYFGAPFIPYLPKINANHNKAWQGYPVNPLKGTVQLLNFQRIVRASMPEITQPILIIQGRQDVTVHPNVPNEIQSKVKSQHVEIHWMENSSHVVILQDELPQVVDLTINFLERFSKINT